VARSKLSEFSLAPFEWNLDRNLRCRKEMYNSTRSAHFNIKPISLMLSSPGIRYHDVRCDSQATLLDLVPRLALRLPPPDLGLQRSAAYALTFSSIY
jgi:hypothetical protein